MRHLDHHRHRHGVGEEEIPAIYGVLLPAGFLLGSKDGHATHPAGCARAGRVGIVAELDPRGQKARGKVAVINGRLGEKSFRGYRRIRPLVAGLLRQIDLLAVQDETYAERFRTLGARPETVHVTGSMKYDVRTDRPQQSDDAAAGRVGRLCRR